jgi:hypothetical protein
MICTEEEEKLKKTPFEVTWTDEASAKPMKAKVVVAEMLGGRRQDKSKEYLYEVLFRNRLSAFLHLVCQESMHSVTSDRADLFLYCCSTLSCSFRNIELLL